MSKAYAFFDVDGTLINSKSMFEFHDFWYEQWDGVNHRHEYEDVTAILSGIEKSDGSRALLNRRYYEFFAGREVSSVSACAQAWAEQALNRPHFFIPETLTRLKGLQHDGIEPVFVSGSFVDLLSPIAMALNVTHILATRPIHDGRRYSGRIALPQTIGPGKASAIQAFLADQGADPAACWAFGDDISDAPMLDLVGSPTAVIGDNELAALAAIRGWPVMVVDAAPRTPIHVSAEVEHAWSGALAPREAVNRGAPI